MKIGIVTTFRIDNYGTKLQAYAMQKNLAQNGDTVCLLDYYPAYDMRPHVVCYKFLKKIRAKIQSLFCGNKKNNSSKQIELGKRHKAIESFNRHYIISAPIKGFWNLKKTVGTYDCFVCGSDQIWAVGNNITDYFNLAFVKGKKPTVAYAPSFGTSHIPQSFQHSYRNFLKNIDYVSVREDSGVRLIQELTGDVVRQVLDPTLLADKMVWDGLIEGYENYLPNQKYIFCYFLGKEGSHRDFALKLSADSGCKLVNLAHMKGFCSEDEKMSGDKLFDVSPELFVCLIKNAEYVCTDSFHGTVFSIIYNKSFFTFERFKTDMEESTNGRIYSLLNMLGLRNRLVENNVVYESLQKSTIYWTAVNCKLELKKQESKSFLYNSLNAIKERNGHN